MLQSTLPKSFKGRPGPPGAPTPSSKATRDKDTQKPTTSARATRSTKAEKEKEKPPPIRKEDTALQDHGVSCADKGRDFLESISLTESEDCYDLELLAAILMQISLLPGIKSNKWNTNAVKAVAYLLGELDATEGRRSIADAISAQLAGQMETLQETAAVVVHDACSKMQEVAMKMAEQVTEAAANLKADVDKSAPSVRDNATKLTETAGTYWDVLARGVPSNPSTHTTAQHESMLTPRSQAREGVRLRQILININTGPEFSTAPPSLGLLSSSVTTLKITLNSALDGCHANTESVRHQAKAATHLRNGGILMELGSDEAVTWFADVAVRSSFLEIIHPGTTIKSRDYHIVVQFVLLTFKPDNDEHLQEVEDVNGIPKGSLVKARWIKLAARWTP